MAGFSNPIIGGDGTLVYPAIKSPGFAAGVSGWQIGKDGSAQFADIVIPAPAIGTTGNNLNPNPFFLGGYGADWHGYLGTFTVEPASAVPSGAPAPFVGHLNGGPGSNAYEGGGVFGVTEGTSVIVNAVVFNPTGTSVRLGLNANGGVENTITVPNGNWTAIQTTITIPAGCNTAFAQVGIDPASSDTDIYFWGVTVQGPVPGGAILAGTVTAQQIAANTITAAQLAAGIIYAGIINGTAVNAATFTGSVFEGTDFVVNASGAFFYSGTPAAGNLVGSWATAAGTDGFGNAYPAGLAVGTSASTQVALAVSAGAGLIEFLANSPGITSALFRSVASPFAQVLFAGPASTAAGHTDSVATEWNASDGSSSANAQFTYDDPAGGSHFYAGYDASGFHATGTVTAVQPGTGTPANPAAAESWHTASLINGWTGQGSLNGIRYRMLPLGAGVIEIEGDLINATATGNSTAATMGAGYHPPASRNEPASWNNPQASNAASAPWVSVDTSGNISLIGIQAANKEIFFHVFVPMD